MRKLRMLWLLALLLSGSATLTGCSSNDDEWSDVESELFDVMGLTRKGGVQGKKGIVITQYERNGKTMQVLDITDQFESATFFDKKIPVNHIYVEQLPPAIQEMAIRYGTDFGTRICRMEYEGEYYYDMYSMLSSTWINIFNSHGERHAFNSTEAFDEFMGKAKGLSCILVLTSEIVKSADGAPNYLVGYWKNNWQDLMHDRDQHTTVSLYPELPFTITEVMLLNEDGTGYLRTVKAYKDGSNEVAYDPFHYELTDYHGGEQYGYHGYYYKCHFEAGDDIEYLARSYDNMQTINNGLYLAYLPWFKITEDPFKSLNVNAGQKYGNPGVNADSPIVGRWTGEYKSDAIAAMTTFTWVFRSDNTGYRLLDGQLNESFAYTASYYGDETELTIYKYNTGFTVEDGFAKNLADLAFDPTILPKGKTIKAKINGNTLELEGWNIYQREYQPE